MPPSRRARLCTLVAAATWAATSHATVDVSGDWNFCLSSNFRAAQRPTGAFTQAGGHVAGTMRYPFFDQHLTCTISFDVDPATGAFVPGTATESCPFGVQFLVRPALASRDRMDGEHGKLTERAWFYALRACDPVVPGVCDDGDPATVDTCATGIDCFNTALAPSCVHTGCTTDEECADAWPCTFDRCDPATGCAHAIVVENNELPPFCEDGDTCTVDERCTLATCRPAAPLTATRMTAARLTLGRLGAPEGDDTIALVGKAVLPAPLTLRPVEHGMRVYVIDANGSPVVDETVFPGEYDPLAGFGWTATANALRYTDRRKADPGAIRRIAIKPDRGAPGLVRFAVRGSAGSYPSSPALPLSAFVNLDLDSYPGNRDPVPLDGAACASFPGAPAARCSAAGRRSQIRCR